MFDYSKIKYEVSMAVSQDEYDIDGIVRDIRDINIDQEDDIESVDDLDSDVFWDIVSKNEK